MIDWLDKLPDSMTGAALGSALWFGFNYAVLAPRAIEKDARGSVMESCMATIARHEAETRQKIDSAIGAIRLPGLDQILKPMLDSVGDLGLTPSERSSRCACALASTRAKLRFDYAVHTASLRLISPESVARFEGDVVERLVSGACGALPGFRGGQS
jgi:hypothetical protein